MRGSGEQVDRDFAEVEAWAAGLKLALETWAASLELTLETWAGTVELAGAAAAAVTAHEAAANPHPTYLTQAEADALYSALAHLHTGVYDPAGTAAAAVTAHEAAVDPHPTYTTQAEVNTSITAHEAAVNPHPTYLTQTEGDALYQPLGGAVVDTYTTAMLLGGM